ncbi:hypothetical protein GCM10009430_28010 [Aquimarina litoralis]|uniref:Uncharacterized protein n=1 Tax=Aquimarina litoralis TaxID=584605 RepID=A0ABN1IYG6_9FLAO
MTTKDYIKVHNPATEVAVHDSDNLITLDPGVSVTLEFTDTEKYTDEEIKNIQWIANMFHGRPQNSTFHKTLKGPKAKFRVPTVYSGGGLGWVEPVIPGHDPQFKPPFGYFINSIGERKIDKIEWRDTHGNEISDSKFFTEAVQLHIYTTGLYGHEIQVTLYDKDTISKNDRLELDENVHDNDTSNLAKYFNREVKVLQDADDNTSKVQKVVIDIRLEKRWAETEESEIELIAEVLCKIDGGVKKLFDQNVLIVKTPEKGEENKVNNATKSGNKPTIIGDIVTDVAEFKPCFYTKIVVEYGKNDKSVSTEYFNKEKAIDCTDEPIQILAGPHKTPVTVSLPDIDTNDCIHKGNSLDHTDKVITLKKKGGNFQVEEKTDKSLKFKQSYPSPSIIEFAKMAWLPNAIPIKHIIQLNTCRYNKEIDIEVYPMLQYELFFKYKTDNPFDTRETKAYTDKKYRGGKGLFTGKEKKKEKKKRKKNRRQAINDRRNSYNEERKAIKEGSLFNYTSFEAGLEYAFGDEGETGFTKNTIPIEGDGPVINAIETGMWIINKLSALSFKKESEDAEKEAEELIENPKSVKDRKKAKQLKGRKRKRNKYLKKVDKVGKKAGKILPFRIQIDQPVFAGAIAWKMAPSTKFPAKIGKEYALKFKADPLIAIEGRLDLLFIATKIPYIGQAIKAITATADAIDGSDDFWNWLVDTFGGDDDDKINIDVDYHVDLFASGELKVEATATKYHTIDGFTSDDIEVKCEFKFGIDCELRAKFQVKKITSEAIIGGQAFAKFTVAKKPEGLECSYDGLFAVVYANFDLDMDQNNGLDNRKDKKKPKDKFKIHDGFKFINETKIA